MPEPIVLKLATVHAPPAEAVTPVNIAKYGYTVLQIETAAACNMACTFCAYPTKEDQQSRMPDEIVRRAILSVDPASDGFQHICFSQFNEPLMDTRIHGFIRFAQQQGF